MRDDYYQTIHFLKADTADQTDIYLYTTNLCFEKKTFNKILYPNTGSLFSINFRYINGNEVTKPGSTSIIRNEFRQNYEWIETNMIFDRYFKFSKVFSWNIFRIYVFNKIYF